MDKIKLKIGDADHEVDTSQVSQALEGLGYTVMTNKDFNKKVTHISLHLDLPPTLPLSLIKNTLNFPNRMARRRRVEMEREGRLLRYM